MELEQSMQLWGLIYHGHLWRCISVPASEGGDVRRHPAAGGTAVQAEPPYAQNHGVRQSASNCTKSVSWIRFREPQQIVIPWSFFAVMHKTPHLHCYHPNENKPLSYIVVNSAVAQYKHVEYPKVSCTDITPADCSSSSLTSMISIQGRVAIVTGSSSGNGRAIALALASEGASIVCGDLTPEVRAGGYEKETTPTHKAIAKSGQAIFQRTDVSSEEDIKALVDAAVKTFGRLDM